MVYKWKKQHTHPTLLSQYKKNEKQQIKKEKTHSAIQHLDKLLWPNTAINYFLIPEIVIGFLIFQNVCELKNLLR